MRILIVVGSARPVRVGDQIAEAVEGVDPVGEDVRTRALPLLDEPTVVVSYGFEASGGGRGANDQLSHVPLMVGAEQTLANSADDLRVVLNSLVGVGA